LVKKIFELFDPVGNGTITVEDFQKHMESINIQLTPEELTKVLVILGSMSGDERFVTQANLLKYLTDKDKHKKEKSKFQKALQNAIILKTVTQSNTFWFLLPSQKKLTV
jgi:Ca2+-binding EF-hand superfamily protein